MPTLGDADNATFTFFDNGHWVSLALRFEFFIGVSGVKSIIPEPWLCALCSEDIAPTLTVHPLVKNPGPDLENIVSVRVKS